MTELPGISGVPTSRPRAEKAARLMAELKAQQAAAPTAAERDVDDQAPPAAQSQGQPVGQGDYTVHEGDCISSIARDSGHLWQTIWDDPANADLRETRENPNVLLPGDHVTIPERHPKQEAGDTELRHRFVRRGEPSMLRLRILLDGEPRRNVPFTLEFDGSQRTGTTDADGKIDEPIPGNAHTARLVVGADDDENRLEYELHLGELDPVSSIRGIQARLQHLGFDVGPIDGVLDPRTRDALRDFQTRNHLTVTGEPDDATQARLQETHGS